MSTARLRDTCFILAVMFPFVALADQEPSFERLSKDQYPALLFIQEDINCDPHNRSSLMIATFDSGKSVVQKVMTSQYVNAVQLTDSVFLLEADQHPKDRSQWEQSRFLVDFQTGSHVLLSRSKSRNKLVHLRCLRSVPDKNEAVILQYGQGTDKSTLIHVDLKTLQTTELYTLPRTDAMRWFHGPHMKISPDFKLIATMAGREQREPRTAYRGSSFSLCVLDLETMKKTVLDDEVMVQISASSSFSGGTPPYEWISNQDILYQHITPEDVDEGEFRHEAQYILKCANVEHKKVTEWFKKRLRLTLDGGNMHLNWLTGELQYQDFTVDTYGHSLIPYQTCYSVKRGPDSTEIRFRDQVLHQHKGHYPYAQGCISHSQEHFAYFIRFDNKDGNPTVFAKTRDMKQQVFVAEVPYYTTLVTWIEDTSNLRKKQPNNRIKSDE